MGLVSRHAWNWCAGAGLGYEGMMGGLYVSPDVERGDTAIQNVRKAPALPGDDIRRRVCGTLSLYWQRSAAQVEKDVDGGRVSSHR